MTRRLPDFPNGEWLGVIEINHCKLLMFLSAPKIWHWYCATVSAFSRTISTHTHLMPVKVLRKPERFYLATLCFHFFLLELCIENKCIIFCVIIAEQTMIEINKVLTVLLKYYSLLWK